MPQLLTAIAPPRRQAILRLVWDTERSAGDIASKFDVSFSAVSQHLKVLRDVGVVTTRREGKSILYRANRIPERSRLAFLKLLGVPLHAGAPARALVAFRPSDRDDPQVRPVGAGLELRAGKLTFHLDAGLDVLPVEAFVCHKAVVPASEQQLAAYRRLYAPILDTDTTPITLYQTTPLGPQGVRFGSLAESVDGADWIALLAPKPDTPDQVHQKLRTALAGRVLNLGLAPVIISEGRELPAHGTVPAEQKTGVRVELCTGVGARPLWVPLGERRGCLHETSVLIFTLPDAAQLVACSCGGSHAETNQSPAADRANWHRIGTARRRCAARTRLPVGADPNPRRRLARSSQGHRMVHGLRRDV